MAGTSLHSLLDLSPNNKDISFTGPVYLGVGILFAISSGLMLFFVALILIILGRGSRYKGTATRWYLSIYFGAAVLSCFGNLLSARWFFIAGVEKGNICIAQAIFKQMGAVSVAVAASMLALHAWSMLWSHPFRKRAARFMLPGLCGILGTYLLIATVAPVGLTLKQSSGSVYSPDAYDCRVGGLPEYRKAYVFLLTVEFSSIAACIFLCAMTIQSLRGKLGRTSVQYIGDPNGRYSADEQETLKVPLKRSIYHVLWYPVSFVATALPYYIARVAHSVADISIPALLWLEIIYTGIGGVMMICIFFIVARYWPLDGLPRHLLTRDGSNLIQLRNLPTHGAARGAGAQQAGVPAGAPTSEYSLDFRCRGDDVESVAASQKYTQSVESLEYTATGNGSGLSRSGQSNQGPVVPAVDHYTSYPMTRVETIQRPNDAYQEHRSGSGRPHGSSRPHKSRRR